MSRLLGRLGPMNRGKLRGGILSAARPLPADYNTWKQGVNFNTACIQQSDENNRTQRECVENDDAPDKLIDTVGGVAEFDPFLVYAGVECSTWLERGDLEKLTQIGFDARLSQAVALELQTSTTSERLNDATVIMGDSIADVTNTLSGLIGTMACTCYQNDILIHAPVRALPFFIEHRLVQWDNARGLWHMGPIDFSFDCYSEVGPGDDDGEDDGSTVWLYATGPVEYAIGPAVTVGRPDGLVIGTNEELSLIEHLAIVRFDPCCTYAAKALVD